MTYKKEKVQGEAVVPKKMLDKANSEAAAYKRKWRTASDEKEGIQKIAESLHCENQVLKYEKHFLMSGYSEKSARESAVALQEGNTEMVFRMQRSHEEKLRRAIRDGVAKEMQILQMKSNLLNELLEENKKGLLGDD